MISIRHAVAADVERIMALIVALAEHHDQAQYVTTTVSEMLASGFGASPRFGVLLAEYEGSVVGFLSFTCNYSIWSGANYMLIDDVYVDEQQRGKRIGEALMEEAKLYCQSQGIDRIKWEVEPGNTSAIRFYERLGASNTVKGVFSWNLKA